MNFGTSMCVGQAAVHGASKQYRQRVASTAAACGGKRRMQIGESRGKSFRRQWRNRIRHGSRLHQILIRVRPPVAEELPGLAHFLDLIEVQIGHQHFIFFARGLGDDLAARIAEIAGAVKLRRCSTALPCPRD